LKTRRNQNEKQKFANPWDGLFLVMLGKVNAAYYYLIGLH